MPKLSIITTVYDRVDDLQNAIWSVQNLEFGDYEHIIVSDCPPLDTVCEIQEMVRRAQDGRIQYFNLPARYNNWGIAPAEYGVQQATGTYLAFLSDDNVYLPTHFNSLLDMLDGDDGLSFVYSACWYADRGLFDCPYPEDCKIDLGQPVFRRQVFKTLFNDTLPFDMMGWDWRLIAAFMTAGGWRFSPEPTFVFRAKMYPQYLSIQAKTVTVVIVFQDSMPWLDVCLGALTRFSNETPVRYLFVENQPHNDQGHKAVDDFVAHHPNASKIINQAPECNDGRAHESGLNAAYPHINTAYTLFMDADCIPVMSNWLDTLMAYQADMIGPIPDSGIKDYSLPILHPCLMLFKTKLASPPYWNTYFGNWNRLHTVDGSDWDVCRPFSYTIGIRPDCKQVKLLNIYTKHQDTTYFVIKAQDSAPLAMHIREASRTLWRHRDGDDRYKALSDLACLTWYDKDIFPPYNPNVEDNHG